MTSGGRWPLGPDSYHRLLSGLKVTARNKPSLEIRVLALEMLVAHLLASRAEAHPESLDELRGTVEAFGTRLAQRSDPRIQNEFSLALRETLSVVRAIMDGLD